jgi:hypothetical protein
LVETLLFFKVFYKFCVLQYACSARLGVFWG